MIESPEIHCKTVGEVKNLIVDWRGEIASDELAVGTPTFTPVSINGEPPSDLTFGVGQVSVAEVVTSECQPIPIGQATEVSVSAGSPGRHSAIAQTTTDKGQILQTRILLDVVAD